MNSQFKKITNCTGRQDTINKSIYYTTESQDLETGYQNIRHRI